MKTLRLLVVEDDAMLAQMLSAMLEEMGHGVCAIEATEAGAVAAAARYKPDLMIVDARLGDGSGVSAVEEILHSGFVPHFFTSGNVKKVRALKPDAIVLEKPFREAGLLQAIQSALAAVPAALRGSGIDPAPNGLDLMEAT